LSSDNSILKLRTLTSAVLTGNHSIRIDLNLSMDVEVGSCVARISMASGVLSAQVAASPDSKMSTDWSHNAGGIPPLWSWWIHISYSNFFNQQLADCPSLPLKVPHRQKSGPDIVNKPNDW
jgi:hypothetical protein